MQMTKNKREVLQNIILLISVVLVFFLIFESFLWITSPKALYERQNEFSFYEYDSLLGWANRPLSTGEFYMPDSLSYIEINKRGIRDDNHIYSKNESIKRVEFFGDSFTWGYGVNKSYRYTEIFEKEYVGIEVINMGTTGYGTDQEYLFFVKEGYKYSPDVVVLAYHNDLIEIARNLTYSYPRPKFEFQNGSLTLTNVPVPQRTINWTDRFDVEEDQTFVRKTDNLLRNIKTYEFLRNRVKSMEIFNKLRSGAYDVSINDTYRVLDGILTAFKNDSENHGAEFVLLIIPDKVQVYGNADTSEIEFVRNWAEREEVAHINLIEELREIGLTNKGIYFDIDGHFSSEGNRIVGEIIAREFSEQKIFKTS